MQKNVGGTDRTTRLVLGTLLILAGAAGYAGFLRVAYLAPQALTSLILIAVGLILVATGATQRCLINSALDKNTYEE